MSRNVVRPDVSEELVPALRTALRGRVLVMGIGNPLRGDDAVGSMVARRLLELTRTAGPRADRTVTILDAEEIPESWLGPASAARPDAILLVDAAELGADPGAVALLERSELGQRALFTHATPLGPVADFLERETGAPVMLLGIQPGLLRWGEALSEPVEAAAADLVLLLADILYADAGADARTEAIAC